MSDSLNVAEIIDSQKVSGFQIRILILCAIALMLDGFDNQGIAYVAPALQAALRLPGGALGPVFTASVVGVALGSIVIGPFADRFGRTRVLISTLLFFGIFSAVVALCGNVAELMAARFLAGLGLGAVIPLVIVLGSEYSPTRHRAKMVTAMLCGYAAGAIAGGFVAVYFVPRFGWTSVFYIGAALPMALALSLVVWMPESIRFLTLQPNSAAKVAKILKRINPDLQFGSEARFHLSAEDFSSIGGARLIQVRQLFLENRKGVTLLLWAGLFMNLIGLNFLNSWLPTLVIHIGVPTAIALKTATALQFGGICGIVSMGFLADKFGYYKVLTTVFLVGCLAIASIGVVGVSLIALIPAIAVAGFAVVGCQMTMGALSATLYPTNIRSTGSSWAFGVARLLSIVGPLAGGVMVDSHWLSSSIFLTAASPMVLAAVFISLMSQAARRREGAVMLVRASDSSTGR